MMSEEPGNTHSKRFWGWSSGILLGMAVLAYLGMGYSWLSTLNSGGDGIRGIADVLERHVTSTAAAGSPEARMLAAQEAMASFASWMFLVALFTLVTTVVGTVFFFKQLAATGKALDLAAASNRHAEEIGKQQVRAYLSLSANVITNEDKLFLNLKVTVQNTGATPANNGYIGIEVFSEDITDKSVRLGESHVAFALGPSGEAIFGLPRSFFDNEKLEAYESSGDTMRIAIEAHYTDVFGDEHKATVGYDRFKHARDDLMFVPEANHFD